MRCVGFDHVTIFIVNPDDAPMTIIQIGRFRDGWKSFEAPGFEPSFLGSRQTIDYAQNRACFRSGVPGRSISSVLPLRARTA
jgi:hypothetical protein